MINSIYESIGLSTDVIQHRFAGHSGFLEFNPSHPLVWPVVVSVHVGLVDNK